MNPRIENLRLYPPQKHHVLRCPGRLEAGQPQYRVCSGRNAAREALGGDARRPDACRTARDPAGREDRIHPHRYRSARNLHPQEWDGIKASHYIHERGTVCNISPDYETTIRLGLDARKAEIASRSTDDSLDQEQRIFLGSVAPASRPCRSLRGVTPSMPARRGRRIQPKVLRPCVARRPVAARGAATAAHPPFRDLGGWHIPQYAGAFRPVHVPLFPP